MTIHVSTQNRAVGLQHSAIDLIEELVDAGSFMSWDAPIDISGHAPEYQEELQRAQVKSGSDEAVRTGAARIGGVQVALIVSEFRFLGGSIGEATADRILSAIVRASNERLPLFVSAASGGTRMQEGTPAFVRMRDITKAIAAHKRAGNAYIVHLRNPCTGGVLASWGSLGHVTYAEPGALIGFLGPKVFSALNQQEFPAGVQLAENLYAHGIIDQVVTIDQLRVELIRLFALITNPVDQTQVTHAVNTEASDRNTATAYGEASLSSWQSVLRSRQPERTDLHAFVAYGVSEQVQLSGTGEGETTRALSISIARIDGVSCVLIGQDRLQQQTEQLGPASLRVARRAMRLANELALPLVTVIDTPGAELSKAAEEGALAGEIARCVADMSMLMVPSIAVLLAEGCGGGALSLFGADTVIAANYAWLSPLPLEGASTIMYADTSHAAELAEKQRVGAAELCALGIVDWVVNAPAGGANHDREFVQMFAAEIGAALRAVVS